jgi:hypothetical protein
MSAIVITPFKIKSIFYNLSLFQQWNEQNISRALEILQTGEGADCVIQVQEQQPNDDGPSPKRSTKISQAGNSTQQQQPQQQSVQSNFKINIKKNNPKKTALFILTRGSSFGHKWAGARQLKFIRTSFGNIVHVLSGVFYEAKRLIDFAH